MARDPINVGSAPDDGTGDYLRVAFGKTNNNFIEIYNSFIMTSKLTIGNSTVNTYLTNTGTVFLGSNTANLYANSSSVYVINSTANMVLLANGIQFYSNAVNATARITITDFYVGNTTSNVIITTTNNTLAFGGNNTTKSTFTANNSDIVIGNNTVVAAPQISLQNSSSKSVFGTRSVSIGNSTSVVVTSLSVQNLTSTFLVNSAAASFVVGSNSLYFDTDYQMLANSSANVKLTPVKISFNEDTTVVNNSGLYVNNSLTYVNTTSFYTSNATANAQLSVAGLTFQANGAAYIRMGNTTVNTASNSSTLYFSTSTSNAVLTSNGLSVDLSVINATSVATGNVFANAITVNSVSVVGGNAVVNSSGLFAVGANISGNSFLVGTVVTSNNVTLGANVSITGNVTSNVTFTNLVGVGKVAANAFIDIAGGNTINAPIKLAGGTRLTTQTAGAIEYDGTVFYGSPGSSRGLITTPQVYLLNSSIAGTTASGTTASMFSVGTSLPVGKYLYEIYFNISHAGATATALQYAFTTSSGSVLQHRYDVISSTSTTGSLPYSGTATYFHNYITTGFNTLVTVTGATPATAGTYNGMRIKGTIDVSVAVTGFNPQYAFTAAPTSSTIIAGSYIAIWPIAASSANVNIGSWA